MKKIVIVIIFFAFSWISVVSADDGHGKRGNWPSKESPESKLICGAGNGQTLSGLSLPETINREQCIFWSSECAPCIISLENQGCKIVDVIVTHLTDFDVVSTYLLSCDGR